MDIDYAAREKKHEAISREVLGAKLSNGCCIPGCNCKDATGPLLMHASCHISAHVNATVFHGDLYLSCGTCGAHVARFEIK